MPPGIVATGTVAYDTVQTPQRKVDHVLGGSVTYFACAAALFDRVGIIAVVGDDFRTEDRSRLQDRGIDITGLMTVPGRTFHWSGSYQGDLAEAETLETQLNVLADFNPVVPKAYQGTDILFLANLAPSLQLRVLDHYPERPRIVAADTMNYWIENDLKTLEQVLEQVDWLLINEGEARLLSGEHHVVRAAKVIQRRGPFSLVIKRGGYGAIVFHGEDIFAVPSYPLEDVVDTTGAGDSFAGGFLGSLAIESAKIRKAVVMGNIVASFAVESFSIERLVSLNRRTLMERYGAFRDFVRLDDL